MVSVIFLSLAHQSNLMATKMFWIILEQCTLALLCSQNHLYTCSFSLPSSRADDKLVSFIATNRTESTLIGSGGRGVCSWAFPSGTSCVFLLLPRIMGAPGNWPISNLFFFSSLSPLAQFVKAQKALQANCGHYRSFQSLCFCRPKKWPGQWAECDSCWWLFLGTASFAGSV